MADPVAAGNVSEHEGEESISRRRLVSPWSQFVNVIALSVAMFYLYTAIRGQVAPQYHRGVFVLGLLVLVFLMYPATKRSPRNRPSLGDLALIVLSAVTIGYWIVEYNYLVYRVGAYLPIDFWMGLVGLAVTLEAGRRVTGWIIPGIGMAALAYGYFGPYMPGILQHRGLSISRMVEYIYLSTEGLFGVMADIVPSYVLLFLILGACLNSSGVGQFLLDIPMSLFGRGVGGPAKVSVASSGLMGSINGSALANTVSTGTLTIPLMKSVGYRPHVAAAVEASASTGGQLLPPVMGAGVFIMVELTGIPYAEIAKAAAIPAILFFLSIFVAVHFEAKREGIAGVTGEKLKSFRQVMKDGWFFLIPFFVLVGLLFRGHSPNYAAFWTIVGTVIVSWFRRDTRMSLNDFTAACIDGVKSCLHVGSLLGAIGILIGVVTLTAAGLRFSHALIGMAGGELFLALIFVALASLVLGTGLPITASYLIVAVLAAPALQEMGASLLAAHLAIFWLSQDSNLTPPVCLGVFAAAAIAKANPWKTAWASLRFALILYIMPFLFAYTHILLSGTPAQNLWAVITCTSGVIVFAAWTQQYWRARTNFVEWLLLLVAWVAIFWPLWPIQAGGMALALTVFLLQGSRTHHAPSAPVPQGT